MKRYIVADDNVVDDNVARSFYGPRYGVCGDGDHFCIIDYDATTLVRGLRYDSEDAAQVKADKLNLTQPRPHAYLDNFYKYCSKRADGGTYAKFVDYFTYTSSDPSRKALYNKLKSFKKRTGTETTCPIQFKQSWRDPSTVVVYEYENM